MLFLHGNSACKEIFSGEIGGDVGKKHRVLAIDLPGHGRSGDASDPAATYALEGYADTAIQVLEALDIDQVAIVGWSLGGHVALEILARFPGVVGVMLVGTPPLARGLEGLMQAYRPHELANLLGQADLTDPQVSQLARAVVGEQYAAGAEAAIRRTDSRARPLLLNSLMTGAFEDERDLVGQSPAPIAVVAGEDDPFVNTDYLAGIAYANLWSGVCHLLPGSGHAPFLGRPDLFGRILTRFAHDMNTRAAMLRDAPPLAYSG